MVSKKIAFNRAAQLYAFVKSYERRGGKAAALLREVGLEHFDIRDHGALIAGNALYRAVQKMSELLEDPFFAAKAMDEFIKSGPIFVRESYEVSHTLAEFLPLAIIELDRQINTISYSLLIKPDVTVVRGDRTFLPTETVTQADAAAVTIWITLLHETVGNAFDPRRILVSAQRLDGVPLDILPKQSRMQHDLNGVSVAFPSQWLACPLKLAWHFQKTDRSEFPDRTGPESILRFVAQVCRDNLSDKSFGIDAFSNFLGANPRNIQRLLKQLGTTFQDIRDDVRQEAGIKLVELNPDMSNDEIADALGFSNASSFSRAFKRWTGKSPSKFRKKK